MGHKYGPGSVELSDVNKEIDSEIHRLLTLLESTDISDGSGKLSDHVDVVIVSDHGMKPNDPNDQTNMSAVIDFNDVDRYLFGGVTGQIWPAEGKLEQVNNIHKIYDHIQC